MNTTTQTNIFLDIPSVSCITRNRQKPNMTSGRKLCIQPDNPPQSIIQRQSITFCKPPAGVTPFEQDAGSDNCLCSCAGRRRKAVFWGCTPIRHESRMHKRFRDGRHRQHPEARGGKERAGLSILSGDFIGQIVGVLIYHGVEPSRSSSWDVGCHLVLPLAMVFCTWQSLCAQRLSPTKRTGFHVHPRGPKGGRGGPRMGENTWAREPFRPYL